MNANFFGQLAHLDITGDIQITISKGAENNLVVSTILNNEQCGDKARQLIMPLNLRGTAAELDEGYFERITTPLQTASGLMVNMEAFMKQLDEAKKQSAMEKEKADKEKKSKEERDKKYKDAMLKADELEAAGKYRDAWTKVPDPALFPEQAETIRKRRTALSNKFAPDLFGATETAVAIAEPQAASTLLNEDTTNGEILDDTEYNDNWEDENEAE
jgi:PRTRC genetic system protein E